MRYVPNLKESFIFYMSTINLESDRILDFLNKHMQICLLKNGLENSILKQSGHADIFLDRYAYTPSII